MGACSGGVQVWGNMKSFAVTIGAVSLALSLSAGGSSAATIDLNFSFGSVSGTFFGLDDTLDGVQQASSFDLVGDLDTYTSVPSSLSNVNLFVFENGSLSDVFFVLAPGSRIPGDSGAADLTQFNVFLSPAEVFFGGVGEAFAGQFVGSSASGIVQFSTGSAPALEPVPLPASGWLVLAGFGGLACLGRKTHRKVRV